MKRIMSVYCIVLLILSLTVSAYADIGSLTFSFSSNTAQLETNTEEKLLDNLYVDFDGSHYPYTGLAKGTRKYTILLYLCGSDLEESLKNHGAATSDLKEIVTSNFNQNEVTLLVMAGGALKWHNNAVDINDTAIYEVIGNTLVKRNSSDGLVSMSSSGTLSRFVNFGMEKFPAEKTALIIWDHGGGPVGNLVYDQLASSAMTMITVRDALKNSKAAQKKLDWIGFDACLMGSVEVAKTLKPFSEYMVASVETEPARGWNYAFLKDIENDAEFSVTGQRILETYMEQNKDIMGSSALTLSCVDLSKIDEVEKATDAFFQDLRSKLSRDTFSTLTEKRQRTLSYTDQNLDLVDLKQLAEALHDLSPKKADVLESAVSSAVIGKVGNVKNSSGLSTYYPYFDVNAYESKRKDLYKDLNYSDNYTRYIDDAVKLQSGSGMASWTTLKSLDPVRDTRTVFTMELTDEQAENLAEYTFAILRECVTADGTIYYVVVNPAGEAEMNGNRLSANYVHNALYIVHDDGTQIAGKEFPISWTTDDSGHYLVNGTLNTAELHTDIQLVCVLNESTERLEIVSIRVWDESGEYYSDRYSIDPSAYDTITFKIPCRVKTYDNEGVLTGVFDWKLLDEVEYTLDLTGNWSLSRLQDSIDPSELYAAFVITDYQRMTHTKLIPVQPASLPDPTFVFTFDDDFLTISNTVTINNNDVYVMFTVTNTKDAEIFVHLDQVTINDELQDIDLWIEGNGKNDGIPSGEQSTDTLVFPGLGVNGLGTIQTIGLQISIVDAETDDIISTQLATGYLNLPQQE